MQTSNTRIETSRNEIPQTKLRKEQKPRKLMETYADEESCYRGRHLWKKTRTPKLNSADIGKETINHTHFPFDLLTSIREQ
jgi:hypothetical protein